MLETVRAFFDARSLQGTDAASIWSGWSKFRLTLLRLSWKKDCKTVVILEHTEMHTTVNYTRQWCCVFVHSNGEVSFFWT